jgi:hypothetical protein
MKISKQTQKLINKFYKHKNKHKPVLNGKCSIGRIKNCQFYEIKDGVEDCKRGWCLCK